MGILKITKTHPDGTVETEEFDTSKQEQKPSGSETKSKKGRKQVSKASPADTEAR